jgi:hypothetical protein
MHDVESNWTLLLIVLHPLNCSTNNALTSTWSWFSAAKTTSSRECSGGMFRRMMPLFVKTCKSMQILLQCKIQRTPLSVNTSNRCGWLSRLANQCGCSCYRARGLWANARRSTVLAIVITVWTERSATPLWWWAPTPANWMIWANRSSWVRYSWDVNAQIFLYDDSIVATVLLECFFRFDGLMCVEASGLDGDDGGESFANLTISLGLVSMSNREFVLGPIRISIKFVCWPESFLFPLRTRRLASRWMVSSG